MKILTRLLFIACLCATSTFAAMAHDPDQISYHFMRFGDGAKLEIHFTPASALEIVKSLNSNLNDSSIIRLSDYMYDFETYFNEHISLKISDIDIRLNLENAHLLQHDAVLNFSLTNFQGSFDEFNLGISAFTEIYRKTANHVTISGINILKQFTLDTFNQTFTHINSDKDEQKSSSQWSLYILLTLLAIAIGFSNHKLRKGLISFRFINQ